MFGSFRTIWFLLLTIVLHNVGRKPHIITIPKWCVSDSITSAIRNTATTYFLEGARAGGDRIAVLRVVGRCGACKRYTRGRGASAPFGWKTVPGMPVSMILVTIKNTPSAGSHPQPLGKVNPRFWQKILEISVDHLVLR